MYKFFIPAKDSVLDIRWLRSHFTEHVFISGIHKSTKGVYVLSNAEDKINAVPVPSCDVEDALFFNDGEDDIDWNKKENVIDLKYVVELTNGKTIMIVPATAQPKQIAFGAFGTKPVKEDIEFAAKYNNGMEYGKAAYDLIYKLNEQDDLTINDPLVMKLITLGLKFSYPTVPLDVINSHFKFSDVDITALFYACMGGAYDELKKDNG